MVNLSKVGGIATSSISNIAAKTSSSTGIGSKAAAAIDSNGAEKLSSTLDALAAQKKPVVLNKRELELIKKINSCEITVLAGIKPEEQTPAVVNALKAKSKEVLGSCANDVIRFEDGTCDYACSPWMQRF